MIQRVMFLVLAVAGAGFVEASYAGGPVTPSPSAVHDSASGLRLEQLLAPLENMTADFRQTVIDVEGVEIQSMEGSMVVARPGKIHWRTNPPFEQLLVADAETLWLYDQDLEQVTVRPFDNDIARTPAVLLIGKVSNLEQKYAVSSMADGAGQAFTLVPTDGSALYQKVEVAFKHDKPAAMTLWDSLGQQTRIEFTSVVINTGIDDSRFRFTIPDGVDVLYE
jgi:outer membrane lipoprotein carrier protein